MLEFKNYLGKIELTESFFKSLVDNILSECTGFFPDSGEKKSKQNWQIRIKNKNGKISIYIHLSAFYGINVPSAAKNIQKRVATKIKEEIGISPEKINIFVDSLRI